MVQTLTEIRAMLDAYGPLTVRYFLTSARYRDKLDFTDDNLNAARSAQQRLITATREARRLLRVYDLPEVGESWRSDEQLAPVWQEFSAAMNDDFNTARALGAMNQFITAINQATTELEKGRDEALAGSIAMRLAMLSRMRWVLGITEELEPADTELDEDTLAGLRGLVSKLSNGASEEIASDELMSHLIELRASARKSKDFAAADTIRNGLQELGILLEDKPGETIWKKA